MITIQKVTSNVQSALGAQRLFDHPVQLLFTPCTKQIVNFVNWYLHAKQDRETDTKFVPFSGENCYQFIGYVNSHNNRRLGFQGFKKKTTHEDFQPYAPAAFTLQEIFLKLISVRAWIDTRAIVRSKGSSQQKIPMNPSGIEPVTY
jgi:hypothetical protein